MNHCFRYLLVVAIVFFSFDKVNANYNPSNYKGLIGVNAGVGVNVWLIFPMISGEVTMNIFPRNKFGFKAINRGSAMFGMYGHTHLAAVEIIPKGRNYNGRYLNRGYGYQVGYGFRNVGLTNDSGNKVRHYYKDRLELAFNVYRNSGLKKQSLFLAYSLYHRSNFDVRNKLNFDVGFIAYLW